MVEGSYEYWETGRGLLGKAEKQSCRKSDNNENENMEIWKHGSMETWVNGNMGEWAHES